MTFPTEFEIALEKALENNFWKVSVVSNKFKVSTKSGIIESIIKTMDSIPGASITTSATVTQAVK